MNIVYPHGAGILARVPSSGGTPRPIADDVICAQYLHNLYLADGFR
jgi:hypothetical protein